MTTTTPPSSARKQMRVQLAFEQGLVAPPLEQKVQTLPAYTLLVMSINLLLFRFIYVTFSIHMPSPSHLCINSTVGTNYLNSKLLASALLGPKSVGAACAKSSTVAQAAVMTARTTLRRVWRKTLASLLAAGF